MDNFRRTVIFALTLLSFLFAGTEADAQAFPRLGQPGTPASEHSANRDQTPAEGSLRSIPDTRRSSAARPIDAASRSQTGDGASVPLDSRPCKWRPNFWIVSTRSCPQHSCPLFQPCAPRCCFDQFLYQDGRCTRMPADAFQKWLIPDAPICVVVHGSFVKFDELLGETRALCRWLHSATPGRPLNVVIFTWPSDEYPLATLPLVINQLGHRSEFNGIYLAQFMQQVPTGRRVSLLGHSHGTRTVSAFLHLQCGGCVQGYRLRAPGHRSRRYRVVFLAAAMEHDWLNPGERYDRSLCAAEAFLNVRNRHDLPLQFYPIRKPFGGRALGKTGFTRKDMRRLGRNAAKVAELDVTRLIGRRHFWIYYFRQPSIAAAVAPYIYFTDDDARSRTPSRHSSAQSRSSASQPARETFSRTRRVSSAQR